MDMPPVDVAMMLDRLASAPYVIEAPAAPSDVREGVVKAMAARGAKTSFIETPNGKGVLDVGTYRDTMKEVRSHLKADLPANPDYTIEFVDLTANPKTEIGRLAGLTSQDKLIRREMREGFKAGGVSHNLDRKGGGRVCFVSPFSQKVNVDKLLELMTGVQVDRGDMTNADFHRQVAWHEVGHCLLGASEHKADAFAALMTIRFSNNEGMLLRWAMWREATELQTKDIMDDHDTSKGIWNIVRMQDKLRGSPDFMKLDINGIAALASAISEKTDFSLDEQIAMREVRVALAIADAKKVHYLPGPKGFKPTDTAGWLRANRDTFAPVGRLFDLVEALEDGRDPGNPKPLDRAAFKRAMADLAKTGDPTAKEILKGMAMLGPAARKILTEDKQMKAKEDARIPLKFKANPVISDKVLSWSADSQRISFSKDQSAYVVKDAETGKVVKAGRVDVSGGTADITLEGRWRAIPAAPGREPEIVAAPVMR